MAAEDQVVSIFAVTNGYLDEVPLLDAKRFESELLDYVRSRLPEIPKAIAETGALDDVNEKKLRDSIEEFKRGFKTGVA